MDVKAAVAWARANVQHFGGDPNFVAIAGCSAGGHLSMTALTPADPAFGAELPVGADTSDAPGPTISNALRVLPDRSSRPPAIVSFTHVPQTNVTVSPDTCRLERVHTRRKGIDDNGLPPVRAAELTKYMFRPRLCSDSIGAVDVLSCDDQTGVRPPRFRGWSLPAMSSTRPREGGMAE